VFGEREQAPDRRTAPVGVAVDAVLDEHGEWPGAVTGVEPAPGGGVERVGQPHGIDRFHPIGPALRSPRLVPLQPADEVPAGTRPQGGHLGHLRAGLLHPVLPERGQPEVQEERDVRGGHGLGDGEQRDVPGTAPGGDAGRVDARADGRQALRQLRPPVRAVTARSR
jgi:hypothetical protein